MEQAANTDRELFREGDFYAPSVHVTQGGHIGMNVGGHVIVMSIREWHALAASRPPPPVPSLHVCGMSGYDSMRDPPCPGCEMPPDKKPTAKEVAEALSDHFLKNKQFTGQK